MFNVFFLWVWFCVFGMNLLEKYRTFDLVCEKCVSRKNQMYVVLLGVVGEKGGRENVKTLTVCYLE